MRDKFNITPLSIILHDTILISIKNFVPINRNYNNIVKFISDKFHKEKSFNAIRILFITCLYRIDLKE